MTGPRFSALPPDAIKDRRLLDTDRAVLNDLGLHADTRTGWCFRAQKTLADEIGVSRRTAQRSLARLVDLGYLEREARLEPGRGQKSNLYRVMFEIAGRRGQLDLFGDELEEQPRALRKAKKTPRHDAPPRRAHGVNDAPPASCAGGKWRTIERPSLNEGYAASRATPIETRGAAKTAPDTVPAVGRETGAVPIPSEPWGTSPDAVPVTEEAPGAVPTSRSDLRILERRLREAGGEAINTAHPAFVVMSEPLGWMSAGCDLDLDILPTIAGLCARPRGSPIRSWSYFAPAVLQARDRRLTAVSVILPDDVRYNPSDAGKIVRLYPKGQGHEGHTRHNVDQDAGHRPGRFSEIAARRRRDLAGRTAGGSNEDA